MTDEPTEVLLDLARKVSDGQELGDVDALPGLAPEEREAAAMLAALGRFFRAGRVDDEAPELPARWGPYQLEGKIGQGAYGEVLRAHDPRLERTVALKLFHAEAGEATRRLAHEGKLLARVRHSHVATVLGVEDHDGRLGLVMELINGQDLASLVSQRGPLSAREAALIGVDLCRALAALHHAQVIHRDVKAENVLREAGGRIVLVDLGLGHELGSADDRAPAAGTPLYLAPEILEGALPSPASDLYALGVLLFFLVSGRYPVEAESLLKLRQAHQAGRRLPLRDVRPDVPWSYARLVEKCLAPLPGDRPPSAGDLERRLITILYPESAEMSQLTSLPPRRRPRRLGVAVAVLVALGLAAAGLGFWLLPSGPRPVDPEAHQLHVQAKEQMDDAEYHTACQLLEAAIERDPDFASAWTELVRCRNGLGDLEGAFRAAEHAYQIRGQMTRQEQLHTEMMYHFDRLQYREGLDAAEELVVLFPDDIMGLRQYAHLSERLGRLPEAIKAMQQASAADPSATNVGLLAGFLVQAGHIEDAFDVIRTARSNSQDEPYLDWIEGLAYIQKNDLGRARVCFERLANAGPFLSEAGAHYLALVEALAGAYENAERQIRANQAQNSRNSYWSTFDWRLLARIAVEQGDLRKLADALAFFDDLQTMPGFLRDFRAAAELWAEAGDVERVKAMRKRLLEVAESYPSDIGRGSILEIDAELARLTGDFAGARELLDKARRKWNDVAMELAAVRLLEKAGDVAEAENTRRLLANRQGEMLRLGYGLEGHLLAADLSPPSSR